MLAAVLACSAPVAVPAAADAALVPLAHSSLVAVEGAVSAGTLLLRVRRASDQQTLTGAALSVSLDGAAAPATERPDGTWVVPLPQPKAGPPGKLEIVVAHDGVREVLDAQLPVAAAAAPAATPAAPPAGTAGKLSALIHKQGSWWVLNIVIVLVGVIAISRRMS